MYTYRQILKQAFKIAWKKPGLWIFGFFLALMGTAGEFEVFLGSVGTGRGGFLTPFIEGVVSGGLFSVTGFQGFASNLVANPFLLLVAIFFLLLAFGTSILGIWLLMVSQGALIGQVIAASKAKDLRFHEGFALGISKFWSVLGVNVIFRLVAWLLLGLSIAASFMVFPGSVFIFIAISGVLLIISAVVSFIIRYALCGIVLRDFNIKKSLATAWVLFKENWVLSFEISLLLFFIYLLTNAFLFFFLGLVLLTALDFFSGFAFGLLLILVVLFIIFVVAEIILAVFYWATWALVFEIIASRKALLKSFVKTTFDKLFS